MSATQQEIRASQQEMRISQQDFRTETQNSLAALSERVASIENFLTTPQRFTRRPLLRAPLQDPVAASTSRVSSPPPCPQDQTPSSPKEPAPVLVQASSSPEDPSEAWYPEVQPHSDQAFGALINDIFGSFDAKGGED